MLSSSLLLLFFAGQYFLEAQFQLTALRPISVWHLKPDDQKVSGHSIEGQTSD